jgi:DNA-binding NtrC family response regulator
VPRVLLCESDVVLANILVELFADEQVDVTLCGSLADIEQALSDYPESVVITDSWMDCRRGQLSRAERAGFDQLADRTAVIVTTAWSWAANAAELNLRPEITVVPKPYDLDQLLNCLRAALETTVDRLPRV